MRKNDCVYNILIQLWIDLHREFLMLHSNWFGLLS